MNTFKKYCWAIGFLFALAACEKGGDDGGNDGSDNNGGGDTPQLSTIKAFPGAEGGGAYVTGGRGHNVYVVTNLEDGGEGSLRAALALGNRTIVFNVSGTIRLRTPLAVPSNVTIAGQTAPGKGITVTNRPLVINSNNVIIRFIRARLGYDGTALDAYDAMEAQNRKNVIIDHCSMSWSVDECASFYDNENFTLQYSIIAESLRNAGHPKGRHGYGGIWGGRNATFHHNLIAYHDSRSPRFNGDRFSGKLNNEKVDFRNNVICGWGGNSGYAGEGGVYNMVNNYYKPLAYSSVKTRIFAPDSDPSNGGDPSALSRKLGGVNKPWWGKFYVMGNYMENRGDNWDWNGIEPRVNAKRDGTLTAEQAKEDIKLAAEVDFINKVNTQPATDAYFAVLAYAGARLNNDEARDAVDVRIVDNVRNGTGAIINKQSDVGGFPEPYGVIQIERAAGFDADKDGMPDEWESVNGVTDAKAKDLDPDYTNLEMYLNSLVIDCFPQ